MDLQLLHTELYQECALIRKDMEIMSATIANTITLRMGSMLVVVIGLLFAALRITWRHDLATVPRGS